MEWPWIGLLMASLALWIGRRAVRFEPAARWLLRAATLALALAIAGLQIRCDRSIQIDVMVDVSPSTRGATFHDPVSLGVRLRQLFPGRDVETRYFADGQVDGLRETSIHFTRLPPSNADAVVLLSDGRFDAPDALPPVYAIVDPALDDPPDARIDDLRLDARGGAVTTHADAADRQLQLDDRPSVPLQAGPRTHLFTATTSIVSARITPSDAWPENDRMSAARPPDRAATPWLISDAAQLPLDAAPYLSASAIVLPADLPLSDLQQDRLIQYARDLGGAVILTGSPARYPAKLRTLTPLSASPPTPQTRWMLLLDASGSMASSGGSQTRWDIALSSAIAATGKLDPHEQLAIATFARSYNVIASDASPSSAVQTLTDLRAQAPAGPTGLEAALRSIASAPGAPSTQLLIISDADAGIDAPETLGDQLAKARVSLFLLATGPVPDDSPLSRLCRRTGGRLIAENDPAQWSRSLETLIRGARGDEVVRETGSLRGERELTGLTLPVQRQFRAYLRNDARRLAGDEEYPAVAMRQAGLGRVVSVALQVDPDTLSTIVRRLERAPDDPRFSTDWDERAERVRVIAGDAARPLNELTLTLHRNGTNTALIQIAPGEYEAPLPRLPVPTSATIEQAGLVIARRIIASRYAKEFDVIGADRAALRALAGRTGGRVIEPGDASPVELPRPAEWRSLRAWLASLGALLLGAAVVLIRAPWLIDVIRKRFLRHARRKVR